MKNKFMKRLKYQVTLVKDKKVVDILPNKDFGINLMDKENSNEIIDSIIEELLRKACKVLKSKGIETVMSSANRENVLEE
ncbi:MAG: hypothetical protein HFJ48_03830 [Clostridia bacterium]|nr:hypothetical protein [Clostridia bacterium]